LKPTIKFIANGDNFNFQAENKSNVLI